MALVTSSSMDDLDLSKFERVRSNDEVAYKYAADDRKMTVYARKRDSIVPFDKFCVEFAEGRMIVAYPRDMRHATAMISLFAKSVESLSTILRIMTCMLSNACFDVWMANALFERSRELMRSMSQSRLEAQRDRFWMQCAAYWPDSYRNAMMYAFAHAL